MKKSNHTSDSAGMENLNRGLARTSGAGELTRSKPGARPRLQKKSKKLIKKRPSNPVAPTTFSNQKVKLAVENPSLTLSLNERLAEAFARAGKAFTDIAGILQGKPDSRLEQVVCPSWMSSTELVNEFLLTKARANRSDRYLRQLRVSLKSFVNGRCHVPIDQVRTPEIEGWLRKREWAPKTARGYLSDVRTLFNFAVKRGYLLRNPAAAVELPPTAADFKIEVHAPDQVREVLETARHADLDVCRHLAVRYFAGLRSAEAHRIRESDLKLEQGLLEVPAVKSKTRARRLVTIQPNLRAWLDLGGELRAVGDMTIRRIIRLSKVPWVHNATRHSFVSYHLAQFKKTNETALEAGHTEQMLFAHYRAIVTPAAAAEFWSILPK